MLYFYWMRPDENNQISPNPENAAPPYSCSSQNLTQLPTRSFLKPSLSRPLLVRGSRFSAHLMGCFFPISLMESFSTQLLNVGVPQILLHSPYTLSIAELTSSYGFKFQNYMMALRFRSTAWHLCARACTVNCPLQYLKDILDLIHLNQAQNRIVDEAPPISPKSTIYAGPPFPRAPKSSHSKSYHF